MKKIDFLSPPSNHDPELQLLREMFPGKAVLTVKETSQVLNVSDDFIYARLNSGTIRGINTGRNWVIPLTEVARLLKKGVK